MGPTFYCGSLVLAFWGWLNIGLISAVVHSCSWILIMKNDYHCCWLLHSAIGIWLSIWLLSNEGLVSASLSLLSLSLSFLWTFPPNCRSCRLLLRSFWSNMTQWWETLLTRAPWKDFLKISLISLVNLNEFLKPLSFKNAYSSNSSCLIFANLMEWSKTSGSCPWGSFTGFNTFFQNSCDIFTLRQIGLFGFSVRGQQYDFWSLDRACH